MAASRVIGTALRAAPSVAFALLVVWSIADLLSIPDPRRAFPLLGLAAAGVALLVLGTRFHSRSTRTAGLICVGAVYLVAHTFVLGIDLVPALVFLSVLIVQVELRILAERFAPLYEVNPGLEAQRRIRAALGRAVLRLTVAAVLSVVVPILAADLAVAGVLPVTTIPTAIALAAALVAVVMFLALLPVLERRPARLG
jgi:hypothetical protein